MTHTLESTRFGQLDVAPEAMIDFPDGLIGVGGSRFVLLAREESSAFLWLHAVDQPDLALPVTDPFAFFPDYAVEIADAEATRIGIGDPDQADVYAIVRAEEQIEEFSVNLLAPILVSDGRGHQVINEAAGAKLRVPLFAGLADQAA